MIKINYYIETVVYMMKLTIFWKETTLTDYYNHNYLVTFSRAFKVQPFPIASLATNKLYLWCKQAPI